MFKLLISAILSFFIFSSCSFKNSLSKKDYLTYLDCPKSLILEPGKSISFENINISLSKDYSINCYFTESYKDDVIFDFNYQLEFDAFSPELKDTDVDFWIFVTNKEETKIILERKFTKFLDFTQAVQGDNQISLLFNDTLKLKRYEYDKGVKIFISLD